MVAGLKGANYLKKCAKLGLETLDKRRMDKYMALVYKFVSQSGSQAQFSRQNGERTRQAAGGHTVPARRDPCKYSFALRTVESWNRLPKRVKTDESSKRRLGGKSKG
jgi:hypothetical protein